MDTFVGFLSIYECTDRSTGVTLAAVCKSELAPESLFTFGRSPVVVERREAQGSIE